MKCLTSALFLLVSLSAHSAFTIGAYNIRNFDYDERSHVQTNKQELVKLIKSLNADVLSVEEVNNTTEFQKMVSMNLYGYDTKLSTCGGAHGQHVGFLFNKKTVEILNFTEDLRLSEPGTPGACNSGSRPLGIALFQIKSTKQKFYGFTAHLKSGSDPQSIAKRLQQYKIMQKIITELTTKSGVKDFYIAGDFNTTEYISRGHDYQGLTQMVSGLGATDLTQKLACSAYWWGGSDDDIETPSLLDHIIVTPGLHKSSYTTSVHAHCKKVSCKSASLVDLGISYAEVSDHCPVTATIN